MSLERRKPRPLELIPSGISVVWTQHQRSRRANVVVFVPAGTPPVELEPAIRGLNRRRIQFRDPCLARVRDHYLVFRVEERPKLGRIVVYYLPAAECVARVRGAA